MIVKMKKVTVVIKSSWLDDVLKTLGREQELCICNLSVPPENNTIVELLERVYS